MELEQRDTSTGTGPVSFGDKSAPLANVQEKSIVTESMPTKNKPPLRQSLRIGPGILKNAFVAGRADHPDDFEL